MALLLFLGKMAMFRVISVLKVSLIKKNINYKFDFNKMFFSIYAIIENNFQNVGLISLCGFKLIWAIK